MSNLVGRLNTLLLVLLTFMAAAIIAILATRASAGPLDPPGPPGSTNGVALPGTPISALPFTISTPGKYYVTGNLTIGSLANGITINANDVTLDLNGYTIDGNNVGSFGIVTTSMGVTIQNGSVAHWTAIGMTIQSPGSGTVEHVYAHHNLTGISISNGSLSDCSADNNSLTGVVALSANVSNCAAQTIMLGSRSTNLHSAAARQEATRSSASTSNHHTSSRARHTGTTSR